MRTLWNVFSVVLLVNVLAVVFAGAVLQRRGHITPERLEKVYDLFKMTAAQEEAQVAKAKKEAEKVEEKARLEAALKRAQSGPKSFGDELAMQRASDELAQLRADRVNAEIKRLRDRLKQERNWVVARVKDLERREKLLKEELKKEAEQREDEDFKLAVQMYEGLKSDQAKTMMQKLIDAGQVDQVVDYLATMQSRKSTAILKEFKTAAEIQTASDLIERMRTRGQRLMPELNEKLKNPDANGGENAVPAGPAAPGAPGAPGQPELTGPQNGAGGETAKRGSRIRIPGVLPRYRWYVQRPKAA